MEIEEQMNELRVTLQQAEKKNIDLNAENRWLQVMIDENVITFDEGINCYTSDIQTRVYSLLQCNVPSSSIASVISAVFKLAKQKTTILPSRTTVHQMNVQKFIIDHKQAEEQFTKQKNMSVK